MEAMGATAAAPVIEPGVAENVDQQHEHERQWDVVVHDDPVNLMTHVVEVFMRVLGMDKATATTRMLEVHHQGRSTVATCDRGDAERYVAELQREMLTATLRPSQAGGAS